MKNKKKRKGVVNYAPRCPYCGSTTVYRSATGIYKDNPNDVMLYVCTNYPNCDAYVQTQKGTAIPLGEMANGELRALRNQAHRYFNKLYLQKYMSKQDAYRWLSSILGVPLEKAHIGLLGKLGCILVIEESQKQLSWYQERATDQKQKKEVRVS